MSKTAFLCVVEQTLHYPGFTLEPSLKQEHGLKETA